VGGLGQQVVEVGVQPRVAEDFVQALPQAGGGEFGDAAMEADPGGGDAGVVEDCGHLGWQGAIGVLEVVFGETFGELQQVDGRGWMQEEVSEGPDSACFAAGARGLEESLAAGVESAEVEVDAGGELVVEDTAQFPGLVMGAVFEGYGEQSLQFSRVTVEDTRCGIDQHRHDMFGADFLRRYL
jgi:hypothetical protein